MVYTGMLWMDQLLGAVAGALTIATGYPLLKNCFADIMHQEVSVGEQQKIVDIVFATNPKIEGLHQLRSRRLGPHLFVDFHLKLPANMLLEEAHEIGDSVIRELVGAFPTADVIVHLDPDSEPDQIGWSPSYRAPDKNSAT
jgi:ferrous-iron efflux pump FieF